MGDTVNIREIAMNILLEIYKDNVPASQAVHSWLEKYQYLGSQERRMINSIVQTTLENQLWIDQVINSYASIKVNKMKPVIRTIMRMGVCQLAFMDGFSDYGICNEMVNLAGRRGFKGLKGFVNGVLRKVARTPECKETVLPDKIKDSENYLSIRYSMPMWIVQLWHKNYGLEKTETMLKAAQGSRETSIRVNTLKIQPEALKEKLEAENIHVTDGNYLPYILKISGYDYLAGLSSFQNGEFFVQDESSALAGALADFKPGNHVLDVCGAPGGKTLNSALLMDGKGYNCVRDVSVDKIDKIRENIKRLQLENIEVGLWDALEFDLEKEQWADVVIADLPCSGLGVTGRKSDIKYRMTQENIDSLVELQRNILSQVWRYVKPGGLLIYSTCTVNPEENQNQVQWFLEQYPFVAEDIDSLLPEGLKRENKEKGMIQIFPEKNGCDGFFAARLRRKEKE